MDIIGEAMDGEINVEEIMKKVKEKMENKISVPQLPVDSVDNNNKVDLLRFNIEHLRSNTHTNSCQYTISSNRRLVGPVLVKGRQLVNSEVRRYVDPIFSKQSEFNIDLVHAIEENNSLLIELIEEKINQAVNKKIDEILSSISADLDNKVWLANILEKRIKDNTLNIGVNQGEHEGLSVDYLAFENKFRGSSQDIRQRQSLFIEYFRQCKNVLDIGCGRGEFLELMKENGIPALGIDIDDGMVSYCIRKGLNVKKEDSLIFLEKEEDASLDGIFMDQVIEHLEPTYLVKLLMLCRKKLVSGGVILLETVNPLSLTSFVNFYIDMTHVRPVHPYTLIYLVQSIGFKDINIKFVAPVPEEFRLKKIDPSPASEESERIAFSTFNSNIDRLNDILFGAQDYVLLGRR